MIRVATLRAGEGHIFETPFQQRAFEREPFITAGATA